MRTRVAIGAIAGVTAIVVMVAIAAGMRSDRGVPPVATATSACGLEPNVAATGEDGTLIYAVDGTGSRDAWVVGTHFDGGDNVPYAARWDGSTWIGTRMPQTIAVFGGSTLQDVVTIAPDDVWAVGTRKNDTPIAYRWGGSAWTVATVPRVPLADESQFMGAAARGSADVWAVGMARLHGEFHTMTQRFDGTSWRIVPPPVPTARSASLQDVAFAGRNDVWAVGWQVDAERRFRTLVGHWDGSSWRVVDAPNGPGQDSYLFGVAALGPDDVWAVGWSGSGAGDERHALAMHWDGSDWRVVETPVPADGRSQFADVTSTPDGIAIAGQIEDAAGRFAPLVVRLSGSTWESVPVASGAATDVFLAGIAATADGALTTVGTGVHAAGHASFIAAGC